MDNNWNFIHSLKIKQLNLQMIKRMITVKLKLLFLKSGILKLFYQHWNEFKDKKETGCNTELCVDVQFKDHIRKNFCNYAIWSPFIANQITKLIEERILGNWKTKTLHFHVRKRKLSFVPSTTLSFSVYVSRFAPNTTPVLFNNRFHCFFEQPILKFNLNWVNLKTKNSISIDLDWMNQLI